MAKNLIKRACSYQAAILTPDDARTYTKIRVTFSQGQEIVITKTEDSLNPTEEGFVVKLTQEETLRFQPSLKSVMGRRIGPPAYMQVRAYKDVYNAPGSESFEIDVMDSQSEEVL